jgi:hypothetical protein
MVVRSLLLLWLKSRPVTEIESISQGTQGARSPAL